MSPAPARRRRGPRESGLTVREGRLYGLFAFDIGWEIDLARLRATLVPHRDGGAGRRAGPALVQFHAPPVEIDLGTRRLPFAGAEVEAQASLRAHAFGAASVVFEIPLVNLGLDRLTALTAELTSTAPWEAMARSCLREIFPRLAPFVERPDATGHGLIEDYYVVQVTTLAPERVAASLLDDERERLARLVHGDPSQLSESEVDEVLRTAVTYTPDDLVVTDWNVALVLDEEYADAVAVLEQLNVQLLELRYVDAMLDRRLNALYDQAERPQRLFSYRREAAWVRELTELRLDAVSLRERTANALKLTGDLYLTKIHARTAERLHLPIWQRSVDGKLELLERLTDVFRDRASTARAEALEIAILVLIALEIVLALVR